MKSVSSTEQYVIRSYRRLLPFISSDCKRHLETSESHLFPTPTDPSNIIRSLALRLAQLPCHKMLSNNQRTAFPNYFTASRVVCTGVQHSARDCRIFPTYSYSFNPLNAELICHLPALLGVHHILHVSRLRVNSFNNLLKTKTHYVYKPTRCTKFLRLDFIFH